MWDETTFDWGPEVWADAEGTTANNGPQVVSTSVLDQTTKSTGQDQWSGFFQNLIGSGVSYAVQKDAAQSGLVRGRAPNGQPIYTAGNSVRVPAALTGGAGTLLLLGGVVVLALLLAQKS